MTLPIGNQFNHFCSKTHIKIWLKTSIIAQNCFNILPILNIFKKKLSKNIDNTGNTDTVSKRN